MYLGKGSQRSTDEFLFSAVMRKNNGLKAGQAYYVEGGYNQVRASLIRYCGQKGSKMTKQDNGWRIIPIADASVPSPVPKIAIPSGLPVAETIADAVKYLKTKPMGSQCGLTGGPTTNTHLAGEFHQRGMRVSCQGNYGHRIITSVALSDVRADNLKDYKASKRKTNEYLIGEIRKRGGIAANVPLYVQGNHTTLVARLIGYVGRGNYSVKQVLDDPRGPGWMVTVSMAVDPA